VSKVDLRLQCGMPCSKLDVSTVQHGTLSGTGYLHQSPPDQQSHHLRHVDARQSRVPLERARLVCVRCGAALTRLAAEDRRPIGSL
jgi:hypothetical protein